MKLEIRCGWAHPYKTIAKFIVHSIYANELNTENQFALYNQIGVRLLFTFDKKSSSAKIKPFIK